MTRKNASILRDYEGPDSTERIIEGARLTDLMQALQRISALQREATGARTENRQKRGEAANKRYDIWVRDAKFIGEVQRLVARGKIVGFGELSPLASQCQAARDDLGQLEQGRSIARNSKRDIFGYQ
ncbi:hypothetical protein PZA11_007121 [Diplocarpon coronariae]